MTMLNLASLPRDEVQKAVRKLCSPFGSVRNVVIGKGGWHSPALEPLRYRPLPKRLGSFGALVSQNRATAKKTPRILVAGVPQTYRRLSTILTGYAPDFADTFHKATAMLQSTMYQLVMIGVHFDQSTMFDLLRYLKASERHTNIPVVCYRARRVGKTQKKDTMRGINLASRALGAAGFIDLFEFADQVAGNVALRKLVDQSLLT
jgi:hypothetical protein